MPRIINLLVPGHGFMKNVLYFERTKVRMKANMLRMAEWKYEKSWGPLVTSLRR